MTTPVMLPPVRLLGALLACAVGGAAMVAGEVDDAPGLVGLGLLVVLGTASLLVPGLTPALLAAVGVVALAAGLSDGEPGVVLAGTALLAAAALGLARRRRRPA